VASAARPELLDDAGHATACHHWRAVLPPARAADATRPVNLRLQRLQSAFIS
jgi:hypothetical protein